MMSINYLGNDKGIKCSKASDSLGDSKDGVKLESGLGRVSHWSAAS